jgi:streptogramin lyase
VDGGGEDLLIVIDVANDVPFTDAAVLDSSLPDTRPDVADATPDAPVILTEIRTIESFRIPTADVVPTSIISGPDGNLWFAEYKTKNIGRVSPTGQIKEFPTPTGVNDLTVGSDKNIWYASADSGSIGRFNPTTAEVTEFTLSGIGKAGWITAGPDGNVWFTDYINGQIGKITTAGVISVYPIDAYPRGIVTGMDGNLWFACDKGVGRMSTDGRDTVFSPVSDGYHWSAGAITVGGDQRIWVTFEDRPGKVGAMSTSGVGTEYRMNLYSSSLPYSYSILPGPDGNVWFADADGLARITPSGVVTVFTMPDGLYAPDYLTIGPDGYIWFTDEKANRIGRMRI